METPSNGRRTEPHPAFRRSSVAGGVVGFPSHPGLAERKPESGQPVRFPHSDRLVCGKLHTTNWIDISFFQKKSLSSIETTEWDRLQVSCLWREGAVRLARWYRKGSSRQDSGLLRSHDSSLCFYPAVADVWN